MKLVILIGIFILLVACGSYKAEQKEEVLLSDKVVFQSPSKQMIPVAKNNESLERLVKAITSKDEDRYNTLVLAGEVFSVENGTKGVITNWKDFGLEVKIEDGKNKGQYVWTSKEMLKKIK